MLKRLRPATVVPVIKRMEQAATRQAEDARLAEKKVATAAKRMQRIHVFATKLASSKTPDELLRTQATAALARLEASIPSRRPVYSPSPDLSLERQRRCARSARYLREICRG